MMDPKELQQIVNPSYTTGKGCLAMLMSTGDPDAAELAKSIDFSELQQGDPMPDSEIRREIVRSYVVGQDARYNVWNRIAEQSDCDVIIDLPCGYLPHGLAAARMGKTYYGFDLPVVINDIAPAIDKLSTEEQKDKIHYCSVDATNFESMKKALCDVKGRICIITDGMLALFNRSELDQVCRAVHRLLSDFGGEWYTSDAMSIDLMALSYEAAIQKDPEIVRRAVVAGSASRSDIDNSENPFVAWDPDRLKVYMEELGFVVESIAYSELLPKLRTADEDMMQRLRTSYSKMIEWRLTAKKEKHNVDPDLPFNVVSEFKDGVFKASIQGRMDTITAPELMKKFNELSEKAEAIEIDAAKMVYISSAGLRVLLIMYKSLEDKNRFKLMNICDEVREILETTGFDQFLL